MKINKVVVKSYLRSLGVAVAMAIGTYTATGGHIGFDLKTVLGVGATLLLPVLPVLQRYADKEDPAFGVVAQMAADQAKKKLEPLANTSGDQPTK